MDKIKVGIVGSQFAAMLHAESYKRCPDVIMHSVAALDNLEKFSSEYSIPVQYKDYREMFEKEELDLLSVCVPNYLHKAVVVAAADAGIKSIICEKPFATSIPDGLEMIGMCKKQQTNLMYAEDWCLRRHSYGQRRFVMKGELEMCCMSRLRKLIMVHTLSLLKKKNTVAVVQ